MFAKKTVESLIYNLFSQLKYVNPLHIKTVFYFFSRIIKKNNKIMKFHSNCCFGLASMLNCSVLQMLLKVVLEKEY